MKLFFSVAFLAAFIVLGVYFKDDVLVLFQLSPKQTYREYFETDMGRVINMKGGNIDFMSKDIWMSFSTPDKVQIKQENEYKIMECDKPSEWFVIASREFTHLRNLDELVCLELNDKTDGSKSWLVQNTKSNTYYFRHLKNN